MVTEAMEEKQRRDRALLGSCGRELLSSVYRQRDVGKIHIWSQMLATVMWPWASCLAFLRLKKEQHLPLWVMRGQTVVFVRRLPRRGPAGTAVAISVSRADTVGCPVGVPAPDRVGAWLKGVCPAEARAAGPWALLNSLF